MKHLRHIKAKMWPALIVCITLASQLLLSKQSAAQFTAIDQGKTQEPILSASSGNDLYSIFQSGNNWSLEYYNGFNWNTLGTWSNVKTHPLHMQVVADTTIIFESIDSGHVRIRRAYKAGGFDTISIPYSELSVQEVNGPVYWNNRLFWIKEISRTLVNIKSDGSQLVSYSNTTGKLMPGVTRLQVINNKLFIYSQADLQIGTGATSRLYSVDQSGNFLAEPGFSFDFRPKRLYIRNGRLEAVGDSATSKLMVCRFDSSTSTWKRVTSTQLLNSDFNEKYSYYGSGNNGIFHFSRTNNQLFNYDGYEIVPFIFDSAFYIRTMIPAQSKVFMTGAIWTNLGKFSQIASYQMQQKKLTIKLFHDKDKDCIYDNGEFKMTGLRVQMMKNTYAQTDKEGMLVYYVLSDSVEIRRPILHNLTSSCFPDLVNFKMNRDTIIEIPMQYLSIGGPINDAHLSLFSNLGFRTRAGFREWYQLNYYNAGESAVSGTIKLKYIGQTGTYTELHTTGPVVEQSSNDSIVEWTVTDLKPFSGGYVRFQVRTDSATTLGVYHTFSAAWDSTNNSIDSVLADNYDTLKLKVVSSVDPNDKTCSPEGEVRPGLPEIRYHIRFQNEGTEPAYRVRVVDTLDMKLPVEEVVLLSASHPYVLHINGNVLTWTFEDILLPSKKENEQASQGYITFKTKVTPGLGIGTEIKNNAHIFFDYQKAVVTNFARVLITDKVGINELEKRRKAIVQTLKVYPNPAEGRIQVEVPNDPNLTSMNIMTVTGQIVKTELVRPNSTSTLEIQDLDAGVYILYHPSGYSCRFVVIK